jgi:hypothetical protein
MIRDTEFRRQIFETRYAAQFGKQGLNPLPGAGNKEIDAFLAQEDGSFQPPAFAKHKQPRTQRAQFRQGDKLIRGNVYNPFHQNKTSVALLSRESKAVHLEKGTAGEARDGIGLNYPLPLLIFFRQIWGIPKYFESQASDKTSPQASEPTMVLINTLRRAGETSPRPFFKSDLGTE